MITITHTFGKARARFERFAAGVRKVPRKASDPEYWQDIAKAEAVRVLQSHANEKNAHLVEAFAETVTVAAFSTDTGATMVWTMEKVKGIALKVADLSEEQKNDIFERRGQLISRDVVAEWVLQAKDRTSADPEDDDELVKRILAILFGPPDPEREAAAKSLLFGHPGSARRDHIAEFAGIVGDALNADELNKWMRNVLRAWRRLIVNELPPLIKQKLHEAWIESAA